MIKLCICDIETRMIWPSAWFSPHMRHQKQILLPFVFSVCSSASSSLAPEILMHHLRLTQFTVSQATGSYPPDRGIFRHLESCTVCPIPSSLICPLLPSGIYACFFYFSDHWAPASLKLIESETCLPEDTLTLSIKEISDFILSIRSKDWAVCSILIHAIPIKLNCRAL